MARSVLSRTQFADGNVRNDLGLGLIAELTHSTRLAAYREYWDFFKGHHWSYNRGNEQPVVTVNFSRKIVNILTGWLFKRGFVVSIPDDPNTEDVSDSEERKFITQALNDTWQANDMHKWGLEAGQMGSVTGDLFMRPSWAENNPYERPYVRIDVLPSHYVFPEFGGPEGVDRKRMESCLVLFPRYEYDDRKSSFFYTPRNRLVIDGERWTKNTWEIIRDEVVIETRQNPYNEIPIIHVPNLILSGEFYGVSDLADILNLQKMYNEKVTDVSDIIEYHGSPVTIVKGQSLKNLERGANQMWGIKKDADIKNLELSGDLQAANNFLDRLERLMSMISGVPKEAMGDIQNAANTSAVAMALRFMPLTDVRDLKEATYGAGIQHMNRLIMKTLRLKDQEFADQWDVLKQKYPDANLYRNEVTFNSPMPRDELIELQKSRERLEQGLTTREIELRNQGKTEEEIKEITESNRQELEEDAMREFGGGSFVPAGAARDEKRSLAEERKLPEVE
jgi:hypothetical protein